MPDITNITIQTAADAGTSIVTMQKWGGLAFFLLFLAFIVAPLIYLTGDL